MNVVFDVDAQHDLVEIHAYYETQRAGLGDRFVHHFRRSIEFMQRFPNACALIDDQRRRCQITPFPYGILYRVDNESGEIKVFAIVHLHSDPRTWRRG